MDYFTKQNSYAKFSDPSFISVMLLLPGLIANQLEAGVYYNVKSPRVSITNTYTTLGGLTGQVQNLYKYRQAGLVIRFYPLTRYFGEKGIYVGATADFNNQIPISNLSIEVDNSKLYQEIDRHESYGYSGLIGYKKDFSINLRNRIGVSLEIKYCIQELSSQSFMFNVFGNATPQDYKERYTNLSAALGLSYYFTPLSR